MRLCTLPCWMETVHFSLQPLQIVCTGGSFNCFFAGSGQNNLPPCLPFRFHGPVLRAATATAKKCDSSGVGRAIEGQGTGDVGSLWLCQALSGTNGEALRPRGKPSSAMTHAHGSSDPPILAPHLGYKAHSIVLPRIGYCTLLFYPFRFDVVGSERRQPVKHMASAGCRHHLQVSLLDCERREIHCAEGDP